MNIKNILITGDDGYNSIGARLLTHFLKKDYDLTVCATKTQQSGVGGKMSSYEKILWHETEIDGIKTFWVDSTPVDTVEFAKTFFKKQFDLAISGINLGPNVTSGAIISSGTVMAAVRLLTLKLAKNAVSIGWNISPDHWFRDHSEQDELTPYLKYPGEIAYNLIKLSIENNFWNSQLLNINLPEKLSTSVIFTKPLDYKRRFYAIPSIDRKTNTFTYVLNPKKIINPDFTDAGAIQNGLISITPCKTDMLNDEAYSKLKGKKIEL